MSENDLPRRWLIGVILVALLAWGLYHTLGVFLYSHDPRQAAIVFGSVAAFLLFWLVLLAFFPPQAKERGEQKPPG